MDTVKSTPKMTTGLSHRPGLMIGLLVGLMLTAALVAIFYVADALVGTPFVPFDMLDWMARNLPGGVITFGIDTVVGIITSLRLGETDVAAKAAEQFISISGMLLTGIVASGVFFYVMNQRETDGHNLRPGYLLGLIIGVPVAVISLAVNFTARTDPAVSTIWIVLAFLAWGSAINWVYNRLAAAKGRSDQPEASAQAIDRRSFLVRVGGTTATITLVGVGLGALLRNSDQGSATSLAATSTTSGTEPMRTDLPNANASVQPVPGTRPEFTPVAEHYRIDISSRPPVIDEATYKLPITGMVDKPLELTLDDIRSNYEPMTQYITLACISNPLGGDLTSTQKWTGVSFQKILADLGLQDSARYLRIFSADSFDETVDIDLIMQDERIMLTYAWDDQPLPERNGFPLRIYIPNHYGMKQPKWITDIEVVGDYEDGYWVRRGWDRDAIMVATSVIDVVATDQVHEEDGTTYIPIGGIAHAGDRSISKVEVKVDDGDWMEAQLRDPLSDKTWVIWRYEWPFAEGNHTFAVRCVDGKGDPQIETSRGTRPSGATGIVTVRKQIDPLTNA
ncbi:MAG: molybdopterin-dependent oxidoreductase [Anaerolineae bacterium]|nr:molybdopterin-dependent oxidoreductase [Anaerolineae bacterium]